MGKTTVNATSFPTNFSSGRSQEVLKAMLHFLMSRSDINAIYLIDMQTKATAVNGKLLHAM